METISLNGLWALWYAPEKAGKPDSYTPSMKDGWQVIPGDVPGQAQLDLVKAGLMKDPFIGGNLHDFYEYEYYQFLYERTFSIPALWLTDRVVLKFEGIDTVADIYVNDQFAGHAANMMVGHEFDITDLLRWNGENRLSVHIHSVMNEARNKEYTVGMRGTAHRNEICWVRKAPHCFGWDIAPRLVTAGLWRGVSLERRKATRITETYYACSRIAPDDQWIDLQYACRFETNRDTLRGFTVRIAGDCGDHHFERTDFAHFISMNYTCRIANPRLWWPKGSGEANLYTVTMQLLLDGEVVDERTERIGLRTLRLERRFTPGDQEFKFFINERPVFMKGTNWVPLDAFHCRDASRLQAAHDLVNDSGSNMMRCWGGNVYEDHPFYDLCDERGILIWQDFTMGNTNYPQTPDFVPVMEEEIGKVVRKLRNHPSIALWCSDNEIDYKNEGFDFPVRDSYYNRVAYEILPRLIQAHDPYRILIKSSPEIPEGFSMYNVPEQHKWGARAWYKDDFYRLVSAKFISEYGFHGCPAPSSIKKFIPEDKLWPLDNEIWAMHSTEDVRIEHHLNGRNEMMRNHLRIMYGQVPDTLEEFALLSQMYQGEAVKYQIELCRMQKWNKTGILWWNMIDCWPQISDSVVDYYFRKKLAYHYIKRAQVPVLVMMGDLQNWAYPVYLTNDAFAPAEVSLTITDADTDEVVFSGCFTAAANETAQIGSVPGFISDKKVYLIRFTVNGEEFGNHFLTGTPAYDPADMKKWLEKIRALPMPFEFEE
ncbi:MAG: hypothetical protein IJE08_06630 [Clostridia bacterium]|nr:hypothetical protein [Clostridia bacterium]